MKKEIHLECPTPPVTSFPLLANMMSILWTHQHDTIGWVSESFIQLIFQHEIDIKYNQYINFYDYEIAYNRPIFMACPFVDCSRFDRGILYFDKHFTFSSFIKKAINQGFYIHVPIDQYYISQAPLYKKKHFVHSSFIHAFDKKGVYIRDFFQGKYRQLYANYNEINQSFEGYEYDPQNEYTTYISLLKYKNNKVRCNLNKVLFDYVDYLNGTDRYRRYENDSRYRDVNFGYGIDSFDVLIRFIENNNINVKPFHIMYDHKVLQVHRLLHMYDIGGVKSSDLIEMAKQIRDDTFLLRNLSLNLIVSYSTVRAKEAVLLCRKIKSTEVELVNRIIIDLNRNNV